MDQLEMKKLAELYNVNLSASVINFATQCYGMGYSDGRKQQEALYLREEKNDNNTDICSD
jgi:hypothetical protein